MTAVVTLARLDSDAAARAIDKRVSNLKCRVHCKTALRQLAATAGPQQSVAARLIERLDQRR